MSYPHYKLSDLLKIGGGYAFKSEDFGDDGYPIVRISNIQDGQVTLDGTARILGSKLGMGKKYPVNPGDILIAMSGATTGKIGVVPSGFEQPAFQNQRVGNFLIQNGNRLDKIYLRYFLESQEFQVQVQNSMWGAAQPNISGKQLESFEIPLPPLAEQQRIAAILDKADALRAKRRTALAKLDTLLQSTFLHMFGDPVTNPMGWEVVKLGDISQELRYGTSAKCHENSQSNDLPILRIPNIVGGELDWSDLKFAKINQSEATNLIMKHGDLLFVRSNGNPEYIGRCAVFKGKKNAAFASYLIRARLDENLLLNPEFVQQVMSFPTYRSFLTRQARTTAGNYNISGSRLKTAPIPKPPKSLQDKFLNSNQKLGFTKRQMLQEAHQLDNLFHALQQRAFKGEL